MITLRNLESNLFILALLIAITIFPASFFAGSEEVLFKLPLFFIVLIICIICALMSGGIFFIRWIFGDIKEELEEIKKSRKE